MKRARVFLVLAVFVLSYSPQAFSKEIANVGSLGGTVQDPQDNPVENVEISAKDADGKVVAHDLTDDEGKYNLGCLAPGQYALTLNSSAAKVQTTAITLGVDGLTVNWNGDGPEIKNPGPTACAAAAGGGGLANPGTVAAGAFGAVGGTGLFVWILCETEVFSGCDDDDGRKRASPFE